MVLLGIDARNRDVGFVYRLDIQVRRTCEPPIFLAVPIFLEILPCHPQHTSGLVSALGSCARNREILGNFTRLAVGVVHAGEFRYLSGLIYCGWL